MRILLSNDDGYQAPGIRVLARALSDLAEVILVAPERDRSGASNSLTLDWPIRAREVAKGVIAVDGTPTDCVHLAITGLLDEEPDMVVAGINSAPNLGDDVIYSGTVAAAMEGRFLGYPAMAISMAAHNPQYYDTGAQVAAFLVERLREQRMSPDNIINVNVPDIPFAALRGFQATRLGNRHKAEPVIKDLDPRGRTIFWVGPAGAEQDAGPGTDFYAVREGYVSVTPLHVDLTRHGFVPELVNWLEGISMA